LSVVTRRRRSSAAVLLTTPFRFVEHAIADVRQKEGAENAPRSPHKPATDVYHGAAAAATVAFTD